MLCVSLFFNMWYNKTRMLGMVMREGAYCRRDSRKEKEYYRKRYHFRSKT